MSPKPEWYLIQDLKNNLRHRCHMTPHKSTKHLEWKPILVLLTIITIVVVIITIIITIYHQSSPVITSRHHSSPFVAIHNSHCHQASPTIYHRAHPDACLGHCPSKTLQSLTVNPGRLVFQPPFLRAETSLSVESTLSFNGYSCFNYVPFLWYIRKGFLLDVGYQIIQSSWMTMTW